MPKIKSITFEQEADSASDLDIQEISLEVVDAGAGPYLVVKTEAWAFDDWAEFRAMFVAMNKVAGPHIISYDALRSKDAHLQETPNE